MRSRKSGQSRTSLFLKYVRGFCWWQNTYRYIFRKGEFHRNLFFFVWGEVVSFLILRGWIEECSISHTHILHDAVRWKSNCTCCWCLARWSHQFSTSMCPFTQPLSHLLARGTYLEYFTSSVAKKMFVRGWKKWGIKLHGKFQLFQQFN